MNSGAVQDLEVASNEPLTLLAPVLVPFLFVAVLATVAMFAWKVYDAAFFDSAVCAHMIVYGDRLFLHTVGQMPHLGWCTLNHVSAVHC